MKKSAHKIEIKARRLLKLYSLWHKTHREDIEAQYLHLLSDILMVNPRFKLRNEFQRAF